MKTRTATATALCTAIFLATALAAQPRRLETELRFGMSISAYNLFKFKNKPQRFSGLRLFGSALMTAKLSGQVQSSYSASLVFYNKSLGNNMNPLVSDIQMDFVNTASLGLGWQGIERRVFDGEFLNESYKVGYAKYLRTMNQAPYYNLKHSFQSAVFLSTNFVINNHKRHQSCGAVTITTGDFSINYYNDGSAPVSWFSLGDGFDRWWTGGLLLIAHGNKGFNYVEASFDQFTGYRPLIYELSNMLGMRVPEYNGHSSSFEPGLDGERLVGPGGDANGHGNGQQQAKEPSVRDRHSSSSYNSSAYNVKVYFKKNYGLDAGFIGSLFKNGRYYGLQDIIHIQSRMAVHPNRDINRFYLGMTYNQSGYEN